MQSNNVLLPFFSRVESKSLSCPLSLPRVVIPDLPCFLWSHAFLWWRTGSSEHYASPNKSCSTCYLYNNTCKALKIEHLIMSVISLPLRNTCGILQLTRTLTHVISFHPSIHPSTYYTDFYQMPMPSLLLATWYKNGHDPYLRGTFKEAYGF
jgi:hypothetical protein